MALNLCVASKPSVFGSVHATACAQLRGLAVTMSEMQIHAEKAADVW